MNIDAVICILIPFFGTALGSGLVLFMKRGFNFFTEDFLSAVAGGIMTAASVWSLIIPAIDNSAHMGAFAFLPCCIGMIAGCGFMIISGRVTDHILASSSGEMARYNNINTLLAVTIHNVPEGMAVGCVLAMALESENESLMVSALALALGIAVQNIPEGAVISLPVYGVGNPKLRAFFIGTASGAVEPLGAVTALLMARVVGVLLPYFLSFAAGTMLFAVTQELIPGIKYKGKFPLVGVGFVAGFMIMMSLDVALG